VSIDDFGTGYSSLAMLSDEIADEVKIDRTFISQVHQRPRSQGILRAIESLCGALGIAVVAEGGDRRGAGLPAPAHRHPLRAGLLVRPAAVRWTSC
jgi:predicted signal transduction protein with EAL and GGDEF domain